MQVGSGMCCVLCCVVLCCVVLWFSFVFRFCLDSGVG